MDQDQNCGSNGLYFQHYHLEQCQIGVIWWNQKDDVCFNLNNDVCQSIHFPVQILCMLHRQKRCHLENCPNPSDQMDFLKRTRISSSPAAIWGERRCCAWMWNQSECSQNSRFFTQCWWWVAWGLWEHLYPTPSRRIKKHGATKTDALLLVYIY